MFNFFKKNQGGPNIYAPFTGKVIPLEEVPDQMFAQKLMGDGLAFVLEDDTLYAPCDAEIKLIAATKHAIGLLNKDGVEMLIHVGLDTVNYQGKGFEVYVKKDQKVKKGEPLLKVDRQFFEEQGVCLITPCIITNHQNFQLDFHHMNETVNCKETLIITYTNKT